MSDEGHRSDVPIYEFEDLEVERDAALVKLAEAEEALWRCVELSGADTSDGRPTFPTLPVYAVQEVEELRKAYDLAPIPEELSEQFKRALRAEADLAEAERLLAKWSMVDTEVRAFLVRHEKTTDKKEIAS